MTFWLLYVQTTGNSVLNNVRFIYLHIDIKRNIEIFLSNCNVYVYYVNENVLYVTFTAKRHTAHYNRYPNYKKTSASNNWRFNVSQFVNSERIFKIQTVLESRENMP